MECHKVKETKSGEHHGRDLSRCFIRIGDVQTNLATLGPSLAPTQWDVVLPLLVTRVPGNTT